MAIKTTSTQILFDGEKFPAHRIQQATNIAAVKALTGADDEEIRLVPGRGIYRYDASSTATGDDDGILLPDDGNGRWHWADPAGAKIGWIDSYDYADLDAMVTGAGSSTIFLRLRPTTHAVTANLTVAATSGLIADPGALMQPASGQTLTINAPIQAGPWPIFDLSAGGSVVLAGAAATAVYPQWFGAKGDDSTNDTVAIQAAIDAMTSGGNLKFPAGTYRVAQTNGTNDVWGLKITNSNVTLVGDGGTGGATLRRHATDISLIANAYPLIFIGTPDSDVAAATENVSLVGLHFYGEDTRHSTSGSSVHDHRCAIEMRNTKGVSITGCTFSRIDSQAIYTIGPATFDQVAGGTTYYNLTKNYDLKIQGCTFKGVAVVAWRAKLHAIHIVGCDNVIIDGNSFEWCDNTVSGDTTYEDLDDTEDDTYAPGYAGWALGNVKRTGRGLVFSNNIVTNSTEHAVYCGFMDVVISGNRIHADDETICTDDAIKIRGKNISVSGNSITGYRAGVTVNEPAFDVTISGNTIQCPGSADGALIQIDTFGLTTYIDARAWLTTYHAMQNVVIADNVLVAKTAAHSSLQGNGVRIYTDLSDANYPNGQVDGVTISGNTFRNVQAGIYLYNTLWRHVHVENNKFYGKAFTEAGFTTSTTQDSRACVMIRENMLTALTKMYFKGNFVYGFEHVFTTELTDGAGIESTGGTAKLTLTANPADTDTVTIGAKTYTFQTTLTNVDGNVHIGPTKEDTVEHLSAAINLGSGSGTDYAAATSAHPNATATYSGAALTVTSTSGSVACPDPSISASWRHLSIPWDISGNRFEYVKYFSSKSMLDPQYLNNFRLNSGRQFLDRGMFDGYALHNIFDDGNGANAGIEGNLLRESGTGEVRFYHDGSGSYKVLNSETGSWTPVFTPASGAFTTVTFDIQQGFYARTGDIVTIWGAMRTTAITVGTATGVLYITGLPYTVSHNHGTPSCHIGHCQDWLGEEPSSALVDYAVPDGVSPKYRSAADGNTAGTQVADLDTGSSKNLIYFSATYITDQ